MATAEAQVTSARRRFHPLPVAINHGQRICDGEARMESARCGWHPLPADFIREAQMESARRG